VNTHSVNHVVAIATFTMKKNAGIGVIPELVNLLLAAAKRTP
jgi:hypothetical protein